MNSASIIICTRNRSASLRETLKAAQCLQKPADLRVDLLVVDNGSTDDTASVVSEFPTIGVAGDIPVGYVAEPRPGQVQARNTGMATSSGEIILFTDDDVILPAVWLEFMCRTIMDNRADAVVGAVRLAPYLRRSWMAPLHRTWLACTEELDREAPLSLIGANMAFHRKVLRKVPVFDPELGPGALGFSDEILFSRQLKRAGFRIGSAFDVQVEHHPESERLSAKSYRRRAEGEGRSLAYIAHHWEHSEVTRPHARIVTCTIRLMRDRLMRIAGGSSSKHIVPEEELRQLVHIAFLKQFIVEQRRPRNYEKFGLERLSHAEAEQAAAQEEAQASQQGDAAAEPKDDATEPAAATP